MQHVGAGRLMEKVVGGWRGVGWGVRGAGGGGMVPLCTAFNQAAPACQGGRSHASASMVP